MRSTEPERAAERMVAEAERQLVDLDETCSRLEKRALELEAQLAVLREVPSSSWPSLRVGCAPPLALLAAALLFEAGVWPLGLLAALGLVAQLVLIPFLSRRHEP